MNNYGLHSVTLIDIWLYFRDIQWYITVVCTKVSEQLSGSDTLVIHMYMVWTNYVIFLAWNKYD